MGDGRGCLATQCIQRKDVEMQKQNYFQRYYLHRVFKQNVVSLQLGSWISSHKKLLLLLLLFLKSGVQTVNSWAGFQNQNTTQVSKLH